MDFSKEFHHEDFEKVFKDCLKDIDVSILINNTATITFDNFFNLKDY